MEPDAIPLSIRGLDYQIADRKLLSGLDLTVHTGESVAVMGPSGSGKSSLLSLALGLIKPQAGQLRVCGTDLVGLSPAQVTRLRRQHIGMVFQFGELLPELMPIENVALPALLSGKRKEPSYQQARRLLEELGVPVDGVATAELSGGERQRAAVARALMESPSLLLADEPTGALDEDSRNHVADVLFATPGQRGCGLLVVTHDRAVAARADRVLYLQHGHLVESAGKDGR
ncbi:lipoprotein-releasing system ATP-binding protein LolD [Streptomyces mashuensis]|uniref:Lipoprotein-releasing system ATP-binding protein LolD n=1 Tax=Streptomyces mashuensis TaxID=33904 RepID=A0A919EE84_9ACTN|nr:ATP-binding cassette domain-containing protein [Streptomyces mashuensis]GHF62404.1 lipoprotein-releasing system ATP-binding protein LolD [Streptomyces mashuensis]